MNRLVIQSGHQLTIPEVATVAEADRTEILLDGPTIERIDAAERAINAAAEEGHAIYGITTGFGPFVKYSSGDLADQRHGGGLIAHLGAGCGAWAARDVVRATMLLRLWTVTRGHSGVRRSVVEAYGELLNQDFYPLTPEIGSVGASGDLVPLAHLVRVLTGEGKVMTPSGEEVGAADALAAVGLEPMKLRPRDALSLTNGTSFLTAYAALAAHRVERLIERAEMITAWSYALLGCRRQALDPRLHEARNQPGQIESARRIAEELDKFAASPDSSRPLQEVYSLRCAPQILGACRDHLSHAKDVIEREIQGVDDNPIVFSDTEDGRLPFAHGGNFQGQQVAFAADAINEAATQTAVIVERQLDAVCNPQLNGGAPLLLASDPGPTSGMAGAQLTATALVAEMRSRCQMHGVYSIPTNGGNQDVVSMGTLAARRALEQVSSLSSVVGIQAIALSQLTHLRRAGIAPGTIVDPPSWAPSVEPIIPDRALRPDIAHAASHLLRDHESPCEIQLTRRRRIRNGGAYAKG